jgi:hypothetical protein
VITVESYTQTLRLGESGTVVFRVVSPLGQKVTIVNMDLTGDGQAGWPLSVSDGTLVAGLRFWPTVPGTHGLVVEAVSENGCLGTTGLRRDVVVQAPGDAPTTTDPKGKGKGMTP